MNILQIDFQEKGYIVLSNFISNEVLTLIRTEIENLIIQDQGCALKPTTFLKSSLLSDTIFSAKFRKIVNQLSAGYRYFIPNFTARKNLIMGWHSDDEFSEPDSEPEIDSETLPSVLQCNIFLQDNSSEFGGGIDVACGTHQMTLEAKKNLIRDDAIHFETAETKAGDLLIFDYRVVHRSTFPTIKPRDSARLTLEWTVCKNIESAREFTANLVAKQRKKLHLSDFTDQRSLGYFFDAANVSYPSSFLASSKQLIEKNMIVVPTVAEMLDFECRQEVDQDEEFECK